MFGALLYALTALAILNYFEILDGLQPSNHPPSAIVTHLFHVAVAGAVVFGISSVVSIFSSHLSVRSGFAASLLSWPYWGHEMVTFPWHHFRPLIPLLFSDVVGPEVAAMFMLTVCSIYAAAKLFSRHHLSAT
jgi:hypothetical protein